MANTFLKAERIVAQAAGLLQRELVLPMLVTRYGQADFIGAKNDTINVRVPSILQGREHEWRTRNAPITIDELEEFTVAVTLDKHPYSAISVTDEELTLDISSWGEQVARPQARAVAEKLESYVAAAMEGATFRHTVTYAPPASVSADDISFYSALVDAARYLNDENVPMAGRAVLLGSNVWARAMKSPHLIKVNESGDDSALRDATMGTVAGFRVVTSSAVDPDFAVAFHQTAFALGNVAPAVPAGVAAGATTTFEGLAMRWVRDYESDYLRDRSVFSSFAGAASVEDGRDFESPVGSGFGELTEENVRAVEIDFVPET